MLNSCVSKNSDVGKIEGGHKKLDGNISGEKELALLNISLPYLIVQVNLKYWKASSNNFGWCWE